MPRLLMKGVSLVAVAGVAVLGAGAGGAAELTVATVGEAAADSAASGVGLVAAVAPCPRDSQRGLSRFFPPAYCLFPAAGPRPSSTPHRSAADTSLPGAASFPRSLFS